MSVLDRFLSRTEAQKDEAIAAARALARQLAADPNNGPSDTEIADTITAAGWTAEDLENEARQQRRRNAALAIVQQYRELAAERPEIERQIAEADRALEQARQQHAQTVRPLRYRLQEIGDASQAASQAKRELRELITPESQQAIDDASSAHRKASARLTAADEALRAAQSRLDNLGREPSGGIEWHKEGTKVVDAKDRATCEQRIREARIALDQARRDEADTRRAVDAATEAALMG